MANHLRAELVIDALEMAVGQRRPGDVIHHSSQYTSLAFGKRCKEAGVRPSMGSVGDAYDNAMCESFFATLNASCWNDDDSPRRPRPAWPASASSRDGTTLSGIILPWATDRRAPTRPPWRPSTQNRSHAAHKDSTKPGQLQLKIKSYTIGDYAVLGVERSRTGLPVALLASLEQSPSYVGDAVVTLKAKEREQFWKTVDQLGTPRSRLAGTLAKRKATWIKEGLVARVRHLKGEEKLRHATIPAIGAKGELPEDVAAAGTLRKSRSYGSKRRMSAPDPGQLGPQEPTAGNARNSRRGRHFGP